MANRLSKETSPYLLQHQDNPVDWFPWGPEAIEKAQKEDKPILLSIGYSACHWCHVMEEESFENPEIAQLMNAGFINIKVDREERPDLDHIYQNVAQVMTKGGGWPLTVFLTPALKPFYGGTYFPPEDKYGRPGFKRILEALSRAYRTDPLSVGKNAIKLSEIIAAFETVSTGDEKTPTAQDLEEVAAQLLKGVDFQNGGLLGAPKFPNTMVLSFLWRFGLAKGDEKAQMATRISLTRMAEGGIYDQLGGGFHRYSVDETWSVPHFEKMLYDNALLLKLYSEVLLTEELVSEKLTSQEKACYLGVLKSTTEYLFREMLSPEGAFYSAQDADSEGEEGKSFVWDLTDLKKVLTEEEAKVVALRYGVRENGNFENGKTVLSIALSISEIAKNVGYSEDHVKNALSSATNKLMKERNHRVPPALDHKILTSWNGLMVSGLTWAARALAQNGLVEEGKKANLAAKKAFRFICDRVRKDESRLFSSFQGGQPKGNGFLDDYAFMAMAALDLSRFSENQREVEDYLENSHQWVQAILDHFKREYIPIENEEEDSEQKFTVVENTAGYFFTSDDHEVLMQRPKTIFDQAIPSGTAVALTCLLALADLDFKGIGDVFTKEVDTQIRYLLKSAKEHPYGTGELLNLVLMRLTGPLALSGPHANEFSVHPHIFQKPSNEKALSLCHLRVCHPFEPGNGKLQRYLSLS